MLLGLAMYQGCMCGIGEAPMVSLYPWCNLLCVHCVPRAHGPELESLCVYFELSGPHWDMSGMGFKDQLKSFSD